MVQTVVRSHNTAPSHSFLARTHIPGYNLFSTKHTSSCKNEEYFVSDTSYFLILIP